MVITGRGVIRVVVVIMGVIMGRVVIMGVIMGLVVIIVVILVVITMILGMVMIMVVIMMVITVIIGLEMIMFVNTVMIVITTLGWVVVLTSLLAVFQIISGNEDVTVEVFCDGSGGVHDHGGAYKRDYGNTGDDDMFLPVTG